MAKDASAKLKEKIALLEARHAEEKRILKYELSTAFEQLKPSNVIKSSVLDLISTLQAEKNIFNIVFGTAAGYLASAVFGPKPTMLNKLGARFLKQAVSIAVTKNSPALADVALNLVTNLRKKVESSKNKDIVTDDIIVTGGEAI